MRASRPTQGRQKKPLLMTKLFYSLRTGRLPLLYKCALFDKTSGLCVAAHQTAFVGKGASTWTTDLASIGKCKTPLCLPSKLSVWVSSSRRSWHLNWLEDMLPDQNVRLVRRWDSRRHSSGYNLAVSYTILSGKEIHFLQLKLEQTLRSLLLTVSFPPRLSYLSLGSLGDIGSGFWKHNFVFF